MSYRLKVLKDNPLSFWPLDESSGSTAYDVSGAQNNGEYSFTPDAKNMPLTPGGILGTKINGSGIITFGNLNGPNGEYIQGNIADSYSSDTAFSIECWIHMNEVTSATIFADQQNDVGLYWDNNSIVFSLSSSKKITYLVPDYLEPIYIVAIYSNDYMKLYINGILVAQDTTTEFLFTNTSFSPQIGSISGGSNSYMIIDAPAIYRREISQKEIDSHFSTSSMLTPVEIADPENGRIFANTDESALFQIRYEYGKNRDIQLFQNDELEYDRLNKCIKMIQTESSEQKIVEQTDIVSIPLFSDAIASKIEWVGDNGISVYTSSTGEENSFVQCSNGFPIPQYQFNDFDTTNLIYIKVVYDSSDTSLYIPRLYGLTVALYGIVEVDSSNSPATLFSDKNISIGSLSKMVICRSKKSGVRTGGDNSFSALDINDTKTIEMVYTPEEVGSATLVSRGSDSVSWNFAGNLSRSGVDSIYINGAIIPVSANIWDYLTVNQPSHILINFTEPGTDRAIFNESGIAAKYECITNYSEGNAVNPKDHYDMYTGLYSEVISNEALYITEIGTPTYDYDFVVLKTV